MKSILNVFAATSVLFAAPAAHAQLQEQEERYVGEIIIVGNKHTPDHYIRELVFFYPGQKLSYPEIRLVERNLRRQNWFRMDEEKGIGPTVQILESKGPFKDILIKVEERPDSWITLAAWDLVLARKTWNPALVGEAVDVVRSGIREWRESK